MTKSHKKRRDFFEVCEQNSRGYADYFSWRTDRIVEEIVVVKILDESLHENNLRFFRNYRSRGEGNDPPDCEAISLSGEAIGIEVTELVDGNSIAAVKRNQPTFDEPFSKTELYEQLETRIEKKDQASEVQGGPYSSYILVIYCDDPRILDF